ncbi:hypothetical protein LXL04_006544 [Taraxacum kok-saghyz]
MVIVNGGRSQIRFSTTILSLSIILIITTTMINGCDGWMKPCNGSTTVESCSGDVLDVIDQELELLIIEAHRRILEGGNSGSGDPIVNQALQPGSPACGDTCGGNLANVGKKRACSTNNYCVSVAD